MPSFLIRVSSRIVNSSRVTKICVIAVNKRPVLLIGLSPNACPPISWLYTANSVTPLITSRITQSHHWLNFCFSENKMTFSIFWLKKNGSIVRKWREGKFPWQCFLLPISSIHPIMPETTGNLPKNSPWKDCPLTLLKIWASQVISHLTHSW